MLVVIGGITGLIIGFYQVKYWGSHKSPIDGHTIKETRFIHPLITMIGGCLATAIIFLLSPILIPYSIIYYIFVGRFSNDNKAKTN